MEIEPVSTAAPAMNVAAQAGETAAGGLPADEREDEVRVQVLNGVGVPGIGHAVGRRLEGAGYRIVLTDNASSFDFSQTRVLVYSESPQARRQAERVRERLGVGTIQVSRQPLSLVDVTIVVGADFEADGGGS